MQVRRWTLVTASVIFGAMTFGAAQQTTQPAATPPADDPVRTLVGRLELERYKATIKGLTQFGIAARNRAQPQGRRLDRSAAQELRLHEHRAHQVRRTGARHRWRRRRWTGRSRWRAR
jgi:hypothetical protein